MAPTRPSLLETYLRKRSELVRFFTQRLRSAAAAEDLVQDIYMRLSGADRGEISDPAAYLYRLGWNLMLDRLKAERRTAARDVEWTRGEIVNSGDFAVDPAPRADVTLETRERLARLLALLETLPPQTQRVFRLHKFEGLSHGETAARLGISRSAVEKHVSTALKRLSGAVE